jgi:hypothetical protein
MSPRAHRHVEPAPHALAQVFPIADADLARLSELLHRMTVCTEDTPATRMAGEAIKVLQTYVVKQEQARHGSN